MASVNTAPTRKGRVISRIVSFFKRNKSAGTSRDTPAALSAGLDEHLQSAHPELRGKSPEIALGPRVRASVAGASLHIPAAVGSTGTPFHKQRSLVRFSATAQRLSHLEGSISQGSIEGSRPHPLRPALKNPLDDLASVAADWSKASPRVSARLSALSSAQGPGVGSVRRPSMEGREPQRRFASPWLEGGREEMGPALQRSSSKLLAKRSIIRSTHQSAREEGVESYPLAATIKRPAVLPDSKSDTALTKPDKMSRKRTMVDDSCASCGCLGAFRRSLTVPASVQASPARQASSVRRSAAHRSRVLPFEQGSAGSQIFTIAPTHSAAGANVLLGGAPNASFRASAGVLELPVILEPPVEDAGIPSAKAGYSHLNKCTGPGTSGILPTPSAVHLSRFAAHASRPGPSELWAVERALVRASEILLKPTPAPVLPLLGT